MTDIINSSRESTTIATTTTTTTTTTGLWVKRKGTQYLCCAREPTVMKDHSRRDTKGVTGNHLSPEREKKKEELIKWILKALKYV